MFVNATSIYEICNKILLFCIHAGICIQAKLKVNKRINCNQMKMLSNCRISFKGTILIKPKN